VAAGSGGAVWGSERLSVAVTVDEASSTRARALCPSALKGIVDRGVVLHEVASAAATQLSVEVDAFGSADDTGAEVQNAN
jgi:hypothetical protein